MSPSEALPPPAAPLADPLHAASALVRAGAIGAALGELDALATGSDALDETGRARLLALRVECRLARGDLAEAMRLADQLAPYVERAGLAAGFAHQAKGELAAALGDAEHAVDHLLAAGRAVAGLPEDPELLSWRAGAALGLVLTGHHHEAAELATEQHRIAVAHGSAYAIAQALRTLAAADPGGHRVRSLREARAVLADVEAGRLAAQVDADLAGLLLLRTDPAALPEAVLLLRGAEQYAGIEELWPLQSRIRRLLDRCGEPPHRLRAEALTVLTPAELRVAGLVAAGLTNRQAAERLEVSVKAVEWHLSRTYRKLGIGSRAGLELAFGVPA
ncbi:helix-turn-helix transcriptional regulator [Nocardioides lijunqiniae]|uniref:helix-turn-helix transcriptional regulator n=1 Tax=Nocardioides lijunqiniae TaxID=2760832 RepID=UPI001877A621|nr:LuxR C-terminal-related transcriptional regulator [Nocardioides lijunqiniae]